MHDPATGAFRLSLFWPHPTHRIGRVPAHDSSGVLHASPRLEARGGLVQLVMDFFPSTLPRRPAAAAPVASHIVSLCSASVGTVRGEHAPQGRGARIRGGRRHRPRHAAAGGAAVPADADGGRVRPGWRNRTGTYRSNRRGGEGRGWGLFSAEINPSGRKSRHILLRFFRKLIHPGGNPVFMLRARKGI